MHQLRNYIFHSPKCPFILIRGGHLVDVAGFGLLLYFREEDDVTKNNSIKGLFAALLLASPIAGAESQYPAADFEPVIITQDADLIAKHSQAAKERALAKPEASSTSQAKPTITEQVKSGAAEAVEQVKSGAADAKESLLAGNYPIALIVLALIGYVFWSTKRSGAQPQPQGSSHYVAPQPEGKAGETGVARYLKSLSPQSTTAETGVAKYLKDLPASTKAAVKETSVSRYLKNLPESTKASGETGVAKYLKNQQ
jgi:hypothetical protein